MTIKTKLWDPAERLKTPEAEFAYLEAAFEDGAPAIIAAALGDIARARGMAKVAKGAGLSRETMYKALRAEGNPTIDTISKIAKELGYRLTIARAA
jgi:probable addiction module antidote protein